HADHFHWDTGKSSPVRAPSPDNSRRPDKSGGDAGQRETSDAERDRRNIRDHARNDSLGGGHAHCGACIYLGDNWPAEYRGKLLTLNLHGRRINVDRLEREGSGYVARHEHDIAQSADPWFRGIDLNYGPDGAGYIIDWSDTGQCPEHAGVHRLSGRVFRISYGESQQRNRDCTKLSIQQLIELHKDPNEWFVRCARRELHDRHIANKSMDVVMRLLHDMFRTESDQRLRLRALFTLQTVDAVTKGDRFRLLDDDNEHVRAAAIQILTEGWPSDTVTGRIQFEPRGVRNPPIFPPEQAERETSSLGRLKLASALQRTPAQWRPGTAAGLLSRVQEADDHNLPKLIWYGLAPLVD